MWIIASLIFIFLFIIFITIEFFKILKMKNRFFIDEHDFTFAELMDTYNSIKKNILLNLFIFTPFYIYLVSLLIIERPFYLIFDIFSLILNILFIDISSYIIHRLFHTKLLYKFHKKSHSIPLIGIGILYCDLLDLYLLKYTPIILGLIIMKSHYTIFIIWMIVGLYNSIFYSHSIINNKDFYYKHHKLENINFGIDFVMNKLFNKHKVCI